MVSLTSLHIYPFWTSLMYGISKLWSPSTGFLHLARFVLQWIQVQQGSFLLIVKCPIVGVNRILPIHSSVDSYLTCCYYGLVCTVFYRVVTIQGRHIGAESLGHSVTPCLMSEGLPGFPQAPLLHPLVIPTSRCVFVPLLEPRASVQATDPPHL